MVGASPAAPGSLPTPPPRGPLPHAAVIRREEKGRKGMQGSRSAGGSIHQPPGTKHDNGAPGCGRLRSDNARPDMGREGATEPAARQRSNNGQPGRVAGENVFFYLTSAPRRDGSCPPPPLPPADQPVDEAVPEGALRGPRLHVPHPVGGTPRPRGGGESPGRPGSAQRCSGGGRGSPVSGRGGAHD